MRAVDNGISRGAGGVLVVDDEPMVLRLAARILAGEGYSVREAVDGWEALELIKREPSGFACVVSDIVMPRLNGVQLMENLALIRPELPVILMSGYASNQLEGFGIAVPCSVLAKPFPAERLVQEVRRCLERVN